MLAGLACASAGMNGREIMVKNEEARKLRSSFAEATLETKTSSGQIRRKQFAWWRKLQDGGSRYHTLTRFREPAEVRGEGVLFLEHEGASEVLLYLPNFKKIRRVEGEQQSGSFMGSEFSYSDLTTRAVADYEYQVAREDAECDPSRPGERCAVVEARPASEEIRDNTGYSRSTLWIRKDNWMQVRGEYFDREGKLLKRMEAADLRQLEPGRWMAMRLRMENTQAGRETKLEFSSVKTAVEIPASTFTPRNLASEQAR